MPQSLAKVLLHVVFSTKNRHPFLQVPEIRTDLYAYVAGTKDTLAMVWSGTLWPSKFSFGNIPAWSIPPLSKA